MPLVDLTNLSPATFPDAEDDVYEFKSSLTSHNELKKKLDRAASGFANSGGGCFIYGVGENGNADGGVAWTVGKQELRDWLDQILSHVTPRLAYDIKVYEDCESRGSLDTGKVVAVVSIHPSDIGPHQASDKKYYIRAGAHTLPAGHYLIEALWARRYMQRPVICHTLRAKPDDPSIAQIGVISLTYAPALDVEFNILPLRGMLASLAKYFPIRLPVVDRDNPFYLDVSLMRMPNEEIGDDVMVLIRYKDQAGNAYEHTNSRPLQESLVPIRIGKGAQVKIADAIEKMERTLSNMARK